MLGLVAGVLVATTTLAPRPLCSRPLASQSQAHSGAVGSALSSASPECSRRGAQKDSAAVRRFLQRYVGPHQRRTTRYSFADVNRSDGTTEEVIVYLSGHDWCGSGGCTLLILAPRGSRYDVIGYTTIVWPPIRLLGTTSAGRHDIAVRIAGGGVRPAREVVLRFDGKHYPSNPTVPPAQPAMTPRGVVLISSTRTGHILFR